MKTLAKLSIVLVLLLSIGCASTGPVSTGITAEVISEPEGAEMTFRGRAVGETPLELPIQTLQDAMDFATVSEQPPLIERRIKVLGPDHVQVIFRLGGEPSAMVSALGLARVVVFDYGERATFASDSYDLERTLFPMLERQAELLNTTFKGIDVYVCGHTDSQGGADHNAVLSINRARTVANFLAEYGVGGERLKIQGFGADYPLASNDTPDGRSLNRRTEIVLPD